jgi:hypothetical protein
MIFGVEPKAQLATQLWLKRVSPVSFGMRARTGHRGGGLSPDTSAKALPDPFFHGSVLNMLPSNDGRCARANLIDDSATRQ